LKSLTRKRRAAAPDESYAPEAVGAERARKLGEVIAEKIMADIASRGWPVGELIGSEADLMARYGVSRAIIGEAVRQVERHGVALMRRGGGRGLVVTSSPAKAVSRSISTYLELCNVSVEEQYEALRLIEVRAVEVAALQASPENCRRLREMAAALLAHPDATQQETMALRLAIADATENPVMGLFMRSLARVLTVYVRPDLRVRGAGSSWLTKMSLELVDMVEAIVAGDVALASQLATRALERREQTSLRLGVVRPDLSPGPLLRDTPQKRAEIVAMSIANDLERLVLPVGEKLGEEPELQARYGASRGVLRQAVRVLETHGLVRTRRGPGGGLFVGLPSNDYTVRSAVAYLRSMNVRLSDVVAVRTDLMGKLAQLATERGDEAQKARLTRALHQLVSGATDAARLHAIKSTYDLLAAMCGNRVLGLLATILNTFVREGALTPQLQALFVSALEGVLAGDSALARRNMTLYLTGEAELLHAD